MGSSKIRPVFSIVIHTPSAFQAKIHAPDPWPTNCTKPQMDVLPDNALQWGT
jgi:hypothetical protein